MGTDRWNLPFGSERRTLRALDRADKLTERGQAGEAVQLLTAANRKHRDRRIDRRLTRLRYEAAMAHDWPTSSPPLPDKADDRFPDELVPEIHRDQLDADAVRSAIDNHGSLLVRQFLDPADAKTLVSDIDATFDSFDAAAAGVEPEADGWYEPFDHPLIEHRQKKRGNGNILAVESPPALFDLIEVLRGAGMQHLAADYLGEEPMLLARKVTLRRLPHAKGGGWHQDGAFMGEHIRSLNVWIALNPCGEDSPGLDIVGKRLDGIVPTGTKGSRFAWSVSPDVAEGTGEDAIVSPLFETGDAMIFDHLCLHKTGTRPGMTVDRYAIECWFFAPSTYQSMLSSAETDSRVYDQVPLVL